MPNIGFWATAGGAGGAAGAYELISTTIASGSETLVNFTAIPSTYTHLQIRMTTRMTGANGAGNLFMRFNNVTTTQYNAHYLYGDGTAVRSGSTGAANNIINLFSTPGSDQTNGIFGANVVDILDYGSTTKNKTLRILSGVFCSSKRVNLVSGLWVNTAAITSIQITNELASAFVTGSRFSLYGIKG